MKKLLSAILILTLCLSVVFSFTACTPDSSTPGADATPTPAPTPVPEDIAPETVDVVGTVWMVTELSFTSDKEYVAARGDQGKVKFFGEFTHKETGKTLTIPGFWDGDDVFKLRFAPTLYGVWEYKTICETDENLAGKTGTIGANAYTGDLKIYQHGFVKVDPTKKYLVYDDGTPFFYLGDTHWSLGAESFDSPGDRAGNTGATSHFKYICDKRVEQGFTVYQSNSQGGDKINLLDGKINRVDVTALQHADKYFKYIAEKGFVHANAEFHISANYFNQISDNKEAIDDLARYWVARFGAYPVMWTLQQEIDNDFYYDQGNQTHTTYLNNPWVYVAECINKYDAYNHPTSGHQENTNHTTTAGNTTTQDSEKGGNGESVFYSEEVTQRTGHDWWASQWPFVLGQGRKFHGVAKEYWESPKPTIMYESRYAYLWTKDFGARAEGWFAFLSGIYGYGYGAQDIWLYNSTYSTESTSFDGYEEVSLQDKKIIWGESVNLPSAYQVGYMRQFFEQIEWWNLVPDFDNNNYFMPARQGENEYAVATKGNEIYVAYFYNRSTGTGTFCNMDGNATYTIKWFNPRTNEYIEIGNNLSPNTKDNNGNPAYYIDNKPERSIEDWVVIAIKNK